MMGIALGGIGVVSLRVPFTLSYSFLRLLDLPSILLATFLAAVFVLIAYFTNPTEASFRAFLTELAFRQHISRLSEAQDLDPDDYEDDSRSSSGTRSPDHKGTRKHSALHGHGHGHGSASTAETPIVFHFANKASVSLRTPGYHFRSFAVLTFAIVSPVEMAVAPLPVPSSSHAHAHPPKPISWSNPATHGAWFIGAFGRWWLGLEMKMHPRQVRFAAQDDVALRERELTRARGDDAEASTGRQSDEAFPPHKASKPGTPRRSFTSAAPRTKAALRERLSLQTSSLHKRETNSHPHPPPRPTTPPPLPKFASLPLHAKRVPPPSPETRKTKSECNGKHSEPLLPTTIGPDTGMPTRARSSSTQEHSPVIADILKQIDAARNATSDLHTQLAEFQDVSVCSQASLQTEVDAARVTKKREDAGRAEVKARTKILDDARRQAEGSKREAEKKLKAASSARDSATGRIERLGREVEELQRRVVEDSARVAESRVQTDVERGEIAEALAAKREEISVAEDVVLALTARARDLEGKIAEETERFQKLKEDAEARRQQLQHATAPAVHTDASSWPPPLLPPVQTTTRGRLANHQQAATLGTDTARSSAEFHGTPSPPRPRPLVLGGLSNIAKLPPHIGGTGNGSALDNPYAPPSQFRPFADSPVTPSSISVYTGALSPMSASLLPASLMQSIETPRSEVSTHSPFFSDTPAVHSSAPDELYSPVDEPLPPSHTNRFDSQRAVLPPRTRSPSHEAEPVSSKPRRWFLA
ncbi:hypothetical protein K439DRAFT_1381475, partial [Ramaria rubella]